MGQAFRIVPRSGFFPPTDNTSFSHNSSIGFPYGWNWTTGDSVGSQAAGSYYLGFGHNLGSFNPPGGLPIGGSGGPFQSTPMGVGPNPQMQGGNNVPFQQPPLRPGHMSSPSNQRIPMVLMWNAYQNGRIPIYASILSKWLSLSSKPVNEGALWPIHSQYYIAFKSEPICEHITSFLGYSQVFIFI